MSYICCKDTHTVPCANCGSQLCPTSGHGEIAGYNKNYEPLCYRCYEHNNNNNKLEKKLFKAEQKLIVLKDRYEREIERLRNQLLQTIKERDELFVQLS